jgi:amino acid permease
LGLFQYCFVAHSVFPSMYRGMKNPEKDFNRAMVGSFTFAGVMYLFVGAFSFAVFGILSTMLGFGSLVWSAVAMDEWDSSHKWIEHGMIPDKWMIEHGIVWVAWKKMPMSLGLFQYCFVAHSVFPSMYRGMKNPEKDFNRAMVGAFTFAGVMYLVVGAFSFAVYGAQAQPSFMENLGRELDLTKIPGYSFLYIACSACFAINLQAQFPLMAAAVIKTLENGTGITDASFVVRTGFKAVFIAATTVVAVLLRNCMSPVQSLVGCFAATNTCLLLPMACGLKMLEMSRASKVAVYVIFIYAVFILFYGSCSNVVEIIQALSDPASL